MHGLQQIARTMRPLSYRGRDRCSASHGNRSAHYSESTARCQSSFTASVQNLWGGKNTGCYLLSSDWPQSKHYKPPQNKENHAVIPGDLLAQNSHANAVNLHESIQPAHHDGREERRPEVFQMAVPRDGREGIGAIRGRTSSWRVEILSRWGIKIALRPIGNQV